MGTGDEALYRPGKVARRLDMSYQSLWRLLKDGRIACVDTPFGRLISEGAVQEFEAERAARRATTAEKRAAGLRSPNAS